ncbi:hypothetical protein [Lysobacter sp. Hz 25]|uniref:hypothetical protein n=1 Tax=Lysobacter sp. Hz 25 TaxID=3383698 RepID=UPI0038D40441
MAATKRLPTALLGCAVFAIAVLAVRPLWNKNTPDTRSDAGTHRADSAIGAAPSTSGGAHSTDAETVAIRRTEAIAAERVRSAAPQAQPPQTYIGPDGKPHPIVYNQGLSLSPGARERLKKELLVEMRERPDAVAKIYEMSEEDIAAVVAGKKPFPEALLNQ